MEWTITINEEPQYLEVITGGIADKTGSLSMVKEIIATMGDSKLKKLLINHENICSVSGDMVDVYSRPKEFQEMGVAHEVRVAEVVKPEHKSFFQFLELVCVNRGFEFSIFDDKESALDWLLDK